MYTADFETTTDPNDCRVWAYGMFNIDNLNTFLYGNNIDAFMLYAEEIAPETIYFHNLKFDGEFILYWLFNHNFNFVTDRKKLVPKTFTTLISDKGQFYSMEICFNERKILTIYDSLKILPFSVEEIAKAFDLPIQKLELDYHAVREIGHELTEEEISYLRNDVEIVAKALYLLFQQGLTKMTQGSNALYDYKQTVTKEKFKKWFPTPEYDSDVRQSYKGGFTYLNKKYADVDLGKGIVLDVNSLYPSVMYYKPLPYGEGVHFDGKYEDDTIYNLYIQNLSCRFELKPEHIPTLQLKNNLSFMPTEYLSSSNDEIVTLCLTNVDLILFKEHYNLYEVDYHGGWKFKSTIGLFKNYIDKWTEVKIKATKKGNKGMRTLAKLMLNALYGKFALNPKVQSKYPYLNEGIIRYRMGPEETRKPIYIPVGTFITAWARFITISSAQSVYDRFVYADTDSLHLIGDDIPAQLKIDDYKLGAWKHESTFTRARFLRQKSYVEEIEGKLNITCAGLPERCYKYVTWDNFHPNVVYGGKLGMKHVKGGIVLVDTSFTIR